VGRLADRLEEAACVLIFAAMAVIAFANVVTRYVIRYSLAFTEEIVVSLFVWLTLLGTAIAFRQSAHLAFTWAADRAPAGFGRVLPWLSAVLGAALFLALAWFALGQIRTERLLGTTSEALAVPQWWYTAGIPVFSVLIVVRILQAAWRTGRSPRSTGR
jgi:TRAP-type C4-dicarboxylate transport system permease small subunit